MEAQERHVLRLEQQAGAKGHLAAAEQHLGGYRAVRRTELPRLVELPVVRQVSLGDHAKDPPAGYHRRAVEQLMLDPQRQPHHQRGGNRLRRIDNVRQGRLAGIEQGALMKQVVAGIGGQAQFRKGHQRRALAGGIPGQRDRFLGIEGRVGHAAHRHAYRHAGEAMGVDIEERVLHVSHVNHPCTARRSASGASRAGKWVVRYMAQFYDARGRRCWSVFG